MLTLVLRKGSNMKKLYFRFGNGKTADLCQTAYNYREGGANIIVMNASMNKEISSHVETNGKRILTLEPNFNINFNLFENGFEFKRRGVTAILVDNAHMLFPNQAEQLFYLCKTFDITVITYGDRLRFGEVPRTSMRLMELANTIEPVDGEGILNNHARLEFYYGAMNASKTAKLLYQAYNLEENGKTVITVKPSIDRSATMISSRIGLSRKADVVLGPKEKIDIDQFRERRIDVILVDEAQFLTASQIDTLVKINQELNIPIRCYGLKTDFLTQHFEGSGKLLGIADLRKLRTICHCAERNGAEFNARRYKDGEYITEGSQVAIDDGKEIAYDSLCERCYLRDVQGIDIDKPEKVLKKLIDRKIVY